LLIVFLSYRITQSDIQVAKYAGSARSDLSSAAINEQFDTCDKT
jgi:hypothetical protein